MPVCAAIGGLHGPTKIGAIGNVGVLVRCTHLKWILCPPWAETLINPRIVNIWGRRVRLLPNKLPGFSRISCFCNSAPSNFVAPQTIQPLKSFHQIAVGNVSHFRMAQTCRHRAKLCSAPTKIWFVPAFADVGRNE